MQLRREIELDQHITVTRSFSEFREGRLRERPAPRERNVLIVVPGDRAGKLATDNPASTRNAGRTTEGGADLPIPKRNFRPAETEKWKLAGQTTIERREP